MKKIARNFLVLLFSLIGATSAFSQANTLIEEVKEVPTEIAYTLMLNSTVYGNFIDSNGRSMRFVDTYDRDVFNTIIIHENDSISLSGSWGVKGNSICSKFNYSKHISAKDLTQKCYTMFLSNKAFIITNVAGAEFGTSTITKIQNKNFEFDFTSGKGMTFEELEIVSQSLLETQKEAGNKEVLRKAYSIPKTPLQKPAQVNDACQNFIGAKIIANDGTYLGIIADKYSTDSIFNKYGTYGSEYSSNSIFNQYGTYGGEYSDQSPFNEYSSNGPKIIRGRDVLGQLSVNEFVPTAVNPYTIIAACSK